MSLNLIRQKFQTLGNGTVTKIIDTKCRTNQDFRKAITILLSNPKKKNAMTPKMMAEFAMIVDELEKDKTTSVVLLQGDAGFFCSGADLSFVTESGSVDIGSDMCKLMQDTTSRFRRLGQISIAVIDGGAVGGGTELASMCDFRCMETKVKFQAIHAARSLSPGWGGASRLSQIIGRRNALMMSTTAKAYTVEECKTLGLVDHVYSASEKESSIEKFYEPFIQHNIQSIHAIKKSIATSTDLGYVEGLKVEAHEFELLWSNAMKRKN